MNTKWNSEVYFARCVGWNGADLGAIKIGVAFEPASRVLSVCSQLPFECELVTSVPGDLFVEFFVHMWLRQQRLGGEYFKAEGETLRVMEHAKQHGALPFPLFETTAGNWSFAGLDVKGFMDRHGISFKEVERLSGISPNHYSKVFERTGTLNRRGFAALAVAAVKRGLSVHWPRDFMPAKMAKAA